MYVLFGEYLQNKKAATIVTAFNYELLNLQVCGATHLNITFVDKRMKAKSIIFLSIGIILILLNVITDISVIHEHSEDVAYNIGTFIGSHLFGFVGIVLLLIAIKQMIKENKKKQMISDTEIENIGRNM